MQRALLQDAHNSIDESRLSRPALENFRNVVQKFKPGNGLGDPIDKDMVVRMGGGTRSSKNQTEMAEQYTRKVAMAVIGGAFLIVPMLVMVLRPGLATSLVTTSVCVFAFGLVMCVFLTKPFEVLSGTAAYAAVLVVFIGTGGGS